MTPHPIITTPDEVPILLIDPERENAGPARNDSTRPFIPTIINYRTLHSIRNCPSPKLWFHQDVITAAQLTDAHVDRLIKQLTSESPITRVHSIRAIASIFTCANHTLSPKVFETFIHTIRAIASDISVLTTPPPEDYLFHQTFFYPKTNHWVCSICLLMCLDSVDVCPCCGASRVPGLEDTTDVATYHQQRLCFAFTRYMYECLHVCSTDMALCKLFNGKDLEQAVAFMKSNDPRSIIICSKFMFCLSRWLIPSTNVIYQNQNGALLSFLKSEFLYSTIQNIVQTLTPSK